MPTRAAACARTARRARLRPWLAAAALAGLLAVPCIAPAQDGEPISSKDRDAPLDVDLDDRVDPVRPGEEVVYEVEIENFTGTTAPGVVLTDTMPPGTTFVVAHRERDWAEVPATVVGNRIEIPLGDVEPCDRPGVPRCRDVWLVLRIDESVAPGTRLENRVDLSSSDPSAFPPTSANVLTTAGSAAIRKATLNAGSPGRDRAMVDADLSRTAWRTRLDPPPPNVDLSQGIRVVVAEPDGPVLADVTLAASELRCTNPTADPNRTRTCRPLNARAMRALGVQKLELTLRATPSTQRNNGRLRVRLNRLDVPAFSIGALSITLEAAGKTYTDAAPLTYIRSGRRASFSKTQGQP